MLTTIELEPTEAAQVRARFETVVYLPTGEILHRYRSQTRIDAVGDHLARVLALVDPE